jgi:hypothetical protein
MTEVVRDFKKMSALLNAASKYYPGHPLPPAFVGILDNHPHRRLNVDRLMSKIHQLHVRGDVTQPLVWSNTKHSN